MSKVNPGQRRESNKDSSSSLKGNEERVDIKLIKLLKTIMDRKILGSV